MSANAPSRPDKAMKFIWKCTKEAADSLNNLSSLEAGLRAKVLSAAENPAKGCPKLFEHAVSVNIDKKDLR